MIVIKMAGLKIIRVCGSEASKVIIELQTIFNCAVEGPDWAQEM